MGKIPITNIKLGKVTTDSGIVCKNPIIKLVGYDNVAINCIYEECGLYELQIPKGVDDNCLTFSVDCNNEKDCRNCEPQLITKCFCNDDGDCHSCATCEKGLCVEKCPEDRCNQGLCGDCTKDTQCPCNQICDGQGNCVCAPGLVLEGDCCVECKEDTECPVCTVCQGGKCVQKDCTTGVCDPQTEECVECVTKDQCGENECCNNNECECCDGYTWDSCNSKCVEIPSGSCDDNTDCGACSDCTNYDPCTGKGVCTPKKCPTGYIAVDADGDGVCECIEECDCNDGSCSDESDKCVGFGTVGCGCVECGGSCEDGCSDGCYCDPSTNSCKADNCNEAPCSTGLDCGLGCGCDDGVCKPCTTLSCVGEECSETLGCECNGSVCESTENKCNNAPCSIGSDCGEGCGCYQGTCEACENFSCDNQDCSNVPGCGCSGNKCVDDKGDCNDKLEIEKVDVECKLIGRLTKDNCCQCPKLTVDTKGKLISKNSTTHVISFIAEVRKGEYDGVSVESVPRVDDFSNTDIAENEPPISGTIQMSYRTTYDLYDIVNDRRVFKGSTVGNAVTSTSGFGSSGKTAQVEFSNISVPSIGLETSDGSEIRVVKKVIIEFKLTNSMKFPNDCVYAPDEISTYEILSDSDYAKFKTDFSYAMAGILESPTCRKALFKWTKSKDSSFNETPFRKLYIDGDTVYEDILDDYHEDELESCYNYLLEVDCNCDEPQEDYIVFCNPEELDYTLESNVCPKCFTINSFDPCTVNRESGIQWRVKAGTIDITFDADTAPIGQKLCSEETIELIEYSVVCDTEGVCTKEYEVEKKELQIEPTTQCDLNNTKFTVTFPNRDSEGICLVDRVEIGGYTISGGGSKVLPSGSYPAIVHWQCGCDPTEVQVVEDCCDIVLSPITRDCDGNIQCSQDTGINYTINGNVIPDICSYLNQSDPDQTITILATKGQCQPATITIPSVGSNCCENFGLTVEEPTNNIAIATVYGGTGDFTISAVIDGGTSQLNIKDNGNRTYTITGHSDGDHVIVTVVDSKCGTETDDFTGGDCDLKTEIREYEQANKCRLIAEIDPETCKCKEGAYLVNITDVINQGTEMEVFYTVNTQGFDAAVIAGTLKVGETDNLITQFRITGSGSVVVPIQNTTSSDCIGGTSTVTSVDGSTDIKLAGQVLTTPNVDNIYVYVVDGIGEVRTFTKVSDSTFTGPTPSLTAGNGKIIIEVVKTNGDSFVSEVTLSSTNTSLSVNACKNTLLPSQSTPVKFELSGFELEDGCKYYTISQIFEVYVNGVVVPTPPQSIALKPSNPTGRKIKHTWLRDGSVIQTSWVGSDENYQTILPEGLTQVGNQYTSLIECQPCTDQDVHNLCCLPTIDVNLIGCNERLDITLTGNQGTYVITFGGNNYTINIPTTGTASLSIESPQGTIGQVTIPGATINCIETFSIEDIQECTPNLRKTCTNKVSDIYEIIITGCNISSMTVLSGSGTVSGNKVIGINVGDQPEIQITDSKGCVVTIPKTETAAGDICDDDPSGACCKIDGTCDSLTQAQCTAIGGKAWWSGRSCNGFYCAPYGTCCEGSTCISTSMTGSDCGIYSGSQNDRTWHEGVFSCSVCQDTTEPTTGSCCSADGDTCYGDDLTLAQCFTAGGAGVSWSSDATCSERGCGGTPVPTPSTGACCDESSNSCIPNLTESQCGNSRTWYEDQDCNDISCGDTPTSVTGACCNTSIGCLITTEDACDTDNGYTFTEGETDCCNTDCGIEDLSCQGRCCYNDGDNCVNSTDKVCRETWLGTWDASKRCSTHPCQDDPVTGSCCYSAGNCQDGVTQDECPNTINTNLTCSQRSDCDSVTPTPPMSACCVDGTCTMMLDSNQSNCLGFWHQGQICESISCVANGECRSYKVTGSIGTNAPFTYTPCGGDTGNGTGSKGTNETESERFCAVQGSVNLIQPQSSAVVDLGKCFDGLNSECFHIREAMDDHPFKFQDNGSTWLAGQSFYYSGTAEFDQSFDYNFNTGFNQGLSRMIIKVNGVTVEDTGYLSTGGIDGLLCCNVPRFGQGNQTGTINLSQGDSLSVEFIIGMNKSHPQYVTGSRDVENKDFCNAGFCSAGAAGARLTLSNCQDLR